LPTRYGSKNVGAADVAIAASVIVKPLQTFSKLLPRLLELLKNTGIR